MVACCVQVPVTPFAGGTSLEGHTMTPYKGITINMNSMKVHMWRATVISNNFISLLEFCLYFFENETYVLLIYTIISRSTLNRIWYLELKYCNRNGFLCERFLHDCVI